MTPLREMHTIHGHYVQIGFGGLSVQKDGSIAEKWLIDNGEMVRMKLGHVTDAFHDFDKGSFALTVQISML